MKTALVLVLVACGGSPSVPEKPRIDVVPAQLPTADEAKVKADTEALFTAIDRGDNAALQAVAGPTFGLFDGGRFYDTSQLTKLVGAHEGDARTRSWKNERAITGKGAAVFFAEATIHFPATEDHPAGDEELYETLVWAHDGTDWKVVHWQEQPAGLAGEEQGWNETFSVGTNFNHKPNALLVSWATGKKPGTALDIDMGQGRNAVFLATQGWKVTGIDISDEGIRQAKAAATAAHASLDAVHVDEGTYDFGANKWDLITLIYAGSSHAKLDKIKGALKKGGTVVIEFFAKEATAGTGIGGFAPGELAEQFKGWKIVKDEVVTDKADWGLRQTKLVRFIAEKP
jgi:SAM-dependent methyltransferase